MRIPEEDIAHPDCQGPQGHTCHRPSGRSCIECGRPAGTLWGPYWCPDCDEERLNRCTRNLLEALGELTEETA